MDRIWEQNKDSVDSGDALVTWCRSELELEQTSHSGGTMRELCRAANQGKELFLIYPDSSDLSVASSHFLHLFLKSGRIFHGPEDLIAYLRDRRPLSQHLTLTAIRQGWQDFQCRD